MTIDPAIADYEPSAAAHRHAECMAALWDRARNLLRQARPIFRQLEARDAAPPTLMDRNRPCGVYPEEFVALIDSMMAADYSKCHDDDCEREDRRMVE